MCAFCQVLVVQGVLRCLLQETQQLGEPLCGPEWSSLWTLFTLLVARYMKHTCRLISLKFLVLRLSCYLFQLKVNFGDVIYLFIYLFIFRIRSLPFLRHLEIFRTVIESFSTKKRDTHNPESTRSFRMLISLPYHYATTPILHNSEKNIYTYIIINCFS